MINGLQVDVQSEELKKIIKSRVDYHLAKVAAYEQQAERLKTSIKDVEEDVEYGKVSGGTDMVSSMAKQAKEHKDKAIHFQFMLDHVILNDTYRLGQQDLALLGIAGRNFY